MAAENLRRILEYDELREAENLPLPSKLGNDQNSPRSEIHGRSEMVAWPTFQDGRY